MFSVKVVYVFIKLLLFSSLENYSRGQSLYSTIIIVVVVAAVVAFVVVTVLP